MKTLESHEKKTEGLYEKVATLIEESRKQVRTAINLTMVYTYYGIGRYIVEDEQKGQYRAAYGRQVLEELSRRLSERYGKGWSVENLQRARKFYQVYSEPANSVNSVDEIRDETIARPEFTLDWSHYLILMRIKSPDERSFYEQECIKSGWNVRIERYFYPRLFKFNIPKVELSTMNQVVRSLISCKIATLRPLWCRNGLLPIVLAIVFRGIVVFKKSDMK